MPKQADMNTHRQASNQAWTASRSSQTWANTILILLLMRESKKFVSVWVHRVWTALLMCLRLLEKDVVCYKQGETNRTSTTNKHKVFMFVEMSSFMFVCLNVFMFFRACIGFFVGSLRWVYIFFHVPVCSLSVFVHACLGLHGLFVRCVRTSNQLWRQE